MFKKDKKDDPAVESTESTNSEADVQAAVEAERKRTTDVLALDSAQGRTDQAVALLKTNLSVEEIDGILQAGAAPAPATDANQESAKTETETPKATENPETNNQFKEAMDKTGSPKVGGSEETGSAELTAGEQFLNDNASAFSIVQADGTLKPVARTEKGVPDLSDRVVTTPSGNPAVAGTRETAAGGV